MGPGVASASGGRLRAVDGGLLPRLDRAGRPIAIVAPSRLGKSTGPHLHFEVIGSDGRPVEPERCWP
jgi:hypothetical protein